ncbi:helix-hairpin-helix domain-containing protein [Patescibacteria group bacterium]|nr:helix-hairpin-helix domain-containing protein [Patescibacteria group bacterium]
MNLLFKIYPYLTTFLGTSLIISFFVIYYDFSQPIPDPIQIIETNIGSEVAANNYQKITIDIRGEVLNPGEFQLSPGSIIQDAIDAAGGLTSNAKIDLDIINPALLLEDKQVITIPPLGISEPDFSKPASSSEISPPATYEDNSLVNLNTATLEQLTTLSGIGPKTAQKIIDYRTNNRFDAIDEIMEVKGIGEKTYAKIKEAITI